VFALSGDEFRELAHALVDEIATFYDSLAVRPVTPDTPRATIQSLLGQQGLPADGQAGKPLLEETAQLLFDHSLHNGHPRFMGYITSSSAPFGALADLLAAAVNSNVGLWDLAPVASEIEGQTIRWLAELIGYPSDCGGLMVSGGNMANLIGFFAARRAKAPWNIREQGLYGDSRRLTLYASAETHTWIQKAADLSGLGTDDIRWIETDAEQRMRTDALEAEIDADRDAGHLPFLVVGTAGTVGTGAVDPLPEIARICGHHELWFHVDGAYGAPAAALPDGPAALRGLVLADSVALDPHKWLFSPIEAGCALVRDPQHLLDAYSFHPDYYRLDSSSTDPKVNYYEYGIQNSRGFRALKVWLTLKHAGRDEYLRMFRSNIDLAKRLFDSAADIAELEAVTHNLSLTTFRYVPIDLTGGDEAAESYLNELNEALLVKLQKSGDAFLSNAVVNGRYLLRACIVNFRTEATDVDALLDVAAELGAALDAELRQAELEVAAS
jgi:glutamate/tyrosine decarboxylase-like PLP-dependent enzyme